MSNDDPWDIGSLHKPGIWMFYILSNYLGVGLCIALIVVVLKNETRITSDIFVCGLASGCLTMSLTCAIQCSINMAADRFYGGDIACQIEAIAHISSVLTEFFCVMLITANMYRSVVLEKELEQWTAVKMVIAIWLGCTFITCIASLFSPIYLMSAGTYCFFAFSSFAIAGWLVPGLIFSLTTMIMCHVKIMKHFKQMLPIAGIVKLHGPTQLTRSQDLWTVQFQWRSTLYIIALLLGWGFAAITTVYELCVGRANEWLVTAVGVGGVTFSWATPLIYLFTSKTFKNFMKERESNSNSKKRAITTPV